jgi:hypothetical protein
MEALWITATRLAHEAVKNVMVANEETRTFVFFWEITVDSEWLRERLLFAYLSVCLFLCLF